MPADYFSRIEGGYFKHPALGQKKDGAGRVSGREVGRYSAAQLAGMSTEEVLVALIRRDLHADAYCLADKAPGLNIKAKTWQSVSKRRFTCVPGVTRWVHCKSRGDRFFCSCGLDMRYTGTGILESINGKKERFATITDWDLWQNSKTETLVSRAGEEHITCDSGISLYKVTPCEQKRAD